MGDEREKHPRTEEPDVEAHRGKVNAIETPADDGDDDTPDVEAHRSKSSGG
jgi:hypothetical protein